MNNKHLSWNKEINNNFIIASRAYFQQCVQWVDAGENMLCQSYFVDFAYAPTCNYYERGKYGRRNFHDNKLPLVMLRLLLFLSSSLHMLVFACLDNLFAYNMPMHRKYVRLRCVCHVFYDALFVLQFLSFLWASLKYLCLARGVKR